MLRSRPGGPNRRHFELSDNEELIGVYGTKDDDYNYSWSDAMIVKLGFIVKVKPDEPVGCPFIEDESD